MLEGLAEAASFVVCKKDLLVKVLGGDKTANLWKWVVSGQEFFNSVRKAIADIPLMLQSAEETSPSAMMTPSLLHLMMHLASSDDRQSFYKLAPGLAVGLTSLQAALANAACKIMARHAQSLRVEFCKFSLCCCCVVCFCLWFVLYFRVVLKQSVVIIAPWSLPNGSGYASFLHHLHVAKPDADAMLRKEVVGQPMDVDDVMNFGLSHRAYFVNLPATKKSVMLQLPGSAAATFSISCDVLSAGSSLLPLAKQLVHLEMCLQEAQNKDSAKAKFGKFSVDSVGTFLDGSKLKSTLACFQTEVAKTFVLADGAAQCLQVVPSPPCQEFLTQCKAKLNKLLLDLAVLVNTENSELGEMCATLIARATHIYDMPSDLEKGLLDGEKVQALCKDRLRESLGIYGFIYGPMIRGVRC